MPRNTNVSILNIHFRAVIMVLLALLGSLSVVACNTVDGAGKDIESMGEGIQDTTD